MSPAAPTLRAWYLCLLSGILPVLLVGFLYSALADRWAFAGWGLLVAALYTAALRQGLGAGWRSARLTAILALLLAAGTLAFARLEVVHQEILDLGFRAVLPALYVPAATRPLTAAAVAAVLAGAGTVALVVDKRATRGGALGRVGVVETVGAPGSLDATDRR